MNPFPEILDPPLWTHYNQRCFQIIILYLRVCLVCCLFLWVFAVSLFVCLFVLFCFLLLLFFFFFFWGGGGGVFFAWIKWRTVKRFVLRIVFANPCTIFQFNFGLSKNYLILKFPALGKHSSTKFEVIRGYVMDDIAENFVTVYLSLISHFSDLYGIK